jgi:hypothetical protein
MRTAAFLVFVLTAAASLGALLPHARAVAAEADDGNGESKKKLPEWFSTQSTEYYTMPQFVVPIIEGNAVTRQITLLVTLETTGSANREKLVDNRARLQDAFLRDIYGVLSVHRPAGKGYHNAVKTRLQVAGDRIVGAGVIDNVLVKTTYDRSFAPAKR